MQSGLARIHPNVKRVISDTPPTNHRPSFSPPTSSPSFFLPLLPSTTKGITPTIQYLAVLDTELLTRLVGSHTVNPSALAGPVYKLSIIHLHINPPRSNSHTYLRPPITSVHSRRGYPTWYVLPTPSSAFPHRPIPRFHLPLPTCFQVCISLLATLGKLPNQPSA